MGMFDKRRFKKLLLFTLNFDVRNPRTYHDMDPNKTTTRDLFSHFDLGLDVTEFTGHAIALHTSERSVSTKTFKRTQIWNKLFQMIQTWALLMSLQLPGPALCRNHQKDPAVLWVFVPPQHQSIPLPSVRAGWTPTGICQVVITCSEQYRYCLENVDCDHLPAVWQLLEVDKCSQKSCFCVTDWVQSTEERSCSTEQWMRLWWTTAKWRQWNLRAR